MKTRSRNDKIIIGVFGSTTMNISKFRCIESAIPRTQRWWDILTRLFLVATLEKFTSCILKRKHLVSEEFGEIVCKKREGPENLTNLYMGGGSGSRK